MVTVIKHLVPDWIKLSFVIFDIRALWRSAECPDVKNYKWLLNPVWHRMLYSCALQLTHMVTVGVRGLDLRFYYKNLTVNLKPFLTGIASELTG